MYTYITEDERQYKKEKGINNSVVEDVKTKMWKLRKMFCSMQYIWAMKWIELKAKINIGTYRIIKVALPCYDILEGEYHVIKFS